MGASKNNQIDDAFFNSEVIDGGENSCNSFATEAYLKTNVPRKKPEPPAQKFIPQTAHEKETYDYLKLTNEEKTAKENEHLLKNHGFKF